MQDIQFGVCLCARFQANPKESHFKAAKRILKYLKGTTNVGYGIHVILTYLLVAFQIRTMQGAHWIGKAQVVFVICLD